jgi:hypothetical protein
MTTRKRDSWHYLVIWEFRVRRGMKGSFVHAYGPEGEWAKLFLQDKNYIGTELIQHLTSPRSYWTLDFWTSRRAYESFRKRHAAEYKRIDAKCGDLTESEREIGRFNR